MASSFDEGTDGSGWILPAGVIQCQWDVRGCPVFKDAHEPAGRDVITNIWFHNIPRPMPFWVAITRLGSSRVIEPLTSIWTVFLPETQTLRIGLLSPVEFEKQQKI